MTRAVLHLDLPEFAPLLAESSVHGIELVDVVSADPTRALFWLDGVDPGAVSDLVDTDPTVETVRHLESDGPNHLYRFEFARGSPLARLHARLVELDGVVERATASTDGWTVDLFVPDQEALSAAFATARELDTCPVVRSITRDVEGRDSYGLTSTQRQTLLTAFEEGYYAIPKDISLVELADELGVSDQAASERLRRAICTLVRETVGSDHVSAGRERERN